MSKKVDTSAVDTQAAALYGKLQTVASEVFVEKGGKRKAAVTVAAQLVTLGYSLRKAAKAAGQKADNSLQRYFEVARAMVNHEEGADKAIAPPEGFASWMDAVAAMPLEGLCSDIRERKAGRVVDVDVSKAVRKYLTGSMERIGKLMHGTVTNKSLEGISVGEAQVKAFVAAWMAGADTAALDAMPLTPLDAKGAAIVDAVKAGTSIADAIEAVKAALPATVTPAVVNG